MCLFIYLEKLHTALAVCGACARLMGYLDQRVDAVNFGARAPPENGGISARGCSSSLPASEFFRLVKLAYNTFELALSKRAKLVIFQSIAIIKAFQKGKEMGFFRAHFFVIALYIVNTTLNWLSACDNIYHTFMVC